ncbi:MYB PROTEIN-RELATED [Salix koriyanagi]|uniref:MYB PROTEIN-RELATED n=1 Tax=Salix koriyanagi TaxID=2511006 RepID=A0A9Q0WU72_9ROSI|nr:MYB PROTEIN-RELATED [Salix koriyanagi]
MSSVNGGDKSKVLRANKKILYCSSLQSEVLTYFFVILMSSVNGGDKIKGSSSQQEDATLIKLVEQHGPRNWSVMSTGLPGRSGKSCRLRWWNQLFTRGATSSIYAQLRMLRLSRHAHHGNKWATGIIGDARVHEPEMSLTLSPPGDGFISMVVVEKEEGGQYRAEKRILAMVERDKVGRRKRLARGPSCGK